MRENKVYVALNKEEGTFINNPNTEEPIIGEESLEEFKKELSGLYNINKVLDMHFIEVTLKDISEENVCSCDVLKKMIKGAHFYSKALKEPVIPLGTKKFSDKVLDIKNKEVYWRPRKLEPITLSKGIIAKKTQTSKGSIVKLTEKEIYRSIDFINDKELLSCYNKAEVYMSPEAYSMYKNWEKKHKSFIKVAEMILNSHRKRIHVQAGNQSGYTSELEVPYKLPYSLFQFKQRVEGLFKNGMTWKNHGEWHLDHRKPLSWFALVKSDGSIDYHQVSESIALCNFKPITAEENMLKGSALEGGFYDKKRYLFDKVLVNKEYRQEDPKKASETESDSKKLARETLRNAREDLDNFEKFYFNSINNNVKDGISIDSALKLYAYETPYVSLEMRKEIEYLFEHRYLCKVNNKYVWREKGNNLKGIGGATEFFKELNKTPNVFKQESPEFQYLVQINPVSFLNVFNFLYSTGALTYREKSIKISEYKSNKAPKIFLTKEVYDDYLNRDKKSTCAKDKIKEDYIDDQIVSELDYIRKKIYEVALLQYGYYESSLIKKVPKININFSFTKQEFKDYIESQCNHIDWANKCDTIPYNHAYGHYSYAYNHYNVLKRKNKGLWLVTSKKPLTEYSFINSDGTVNYSEVQKATSLDNFKVAYTGCFEYKKVPVTILYKKVLNYHLKRKKMIDDIMEDYTDGEIKSLRREGIIFPKVIKGFRCVWVPSEVTFNEGANELDFNLGNTDDFGLSKVEDLSIYD